MKVTLAAHDGGGHEGAQCLRTDLIYSEQFAQADGERAARLNDPTDGNQLHTLGGGEQVDLKLGGEHLAAGRQ